MEGHKIDFSNTKLLAKLDNERHRIIREAIEIERRPASMNSRDDAQRLPTAWKPLLDDRKIITRTTRAIPDEIEHNGTKNKTTTSSNTHETKKTTGRRTSIVKTERRVTRSMTASKRKDVDESHD